MPKRLLHHIQEHPTRLIATSAAMLFSSLALLGFALYYNFSTNHNHVDQRHEATVANCVALNELRRQIYTASLDLGIKQSIALRFLPHRDCEALP